MASPPHCCDAAVTTHVVPGSRVPDSQTLTVAFESHERSNKQPASAPRTCPTRRMTASIAIGLKAGLGSDWDRVTAASNPNPRHLRSDEARDLTDARARRLPLSRFSHGIGVRYRPGMLKPTILVTTGLAMTRVLTDFLLFSCLVMFVRGVVLAAVVCRC